mmetsp:Transcript_122161/g.390703  ORF Transcript_122161/g.390703 Transcript_122161/m.390703 type:complete len:793 (-) Transcript_122161:170-2548(-)
MIKLIVLTLALPDYSRGLDLSYIPENCPVIIDCERLRDDLREVSDTAYPECLVVQEIALQALTWSWPHHQEKGVDRFWTLMCSKCLADYYANDGYSPGKKAVLCLMTTAGYLMRLLKWAKRADLAQTLLESAKKALPWIFVSWLDVYETPDLTTWDLSTMHEPIMQPPSGGWWPPDHDGVRQVVELLHHGFGRILQDFRRSRIALKRDHFGRGGPSDERFGWGGSPIWTLGGWNAKACKLLPSICEVLGTVVPTASRPMLYRNQEVISMQCIEPGGMLLPHNDPERVSIMLCLSGCAGAWLELAQDRRYFEGVGSILAFDNIVEHSAGNDGDEDRWVLNVVVSHPHYDELFDSFTTTTPTFRPSIQATSKAPVLQCAHGVRAMCRRSPPLPSVHEAARGLLGSFQSKAVRRQQALAETFNCSTGRLGQLPPDISSLAHLLQHNSGLSMAGVNWMQGTVTFHLEYLKADLAIFVGAAAVEASKHHCSELQGMIDWRVGVDGDAKESEVDLTQPVNLTDFLDLPLWVLPGGELDGDLARHAVRQISRWHLRHLHRERAALLRSAPIDLDARMRGIVAGRLSAMLEHLFALHTVNAFAIAVQQGTFTSALPPVTFQGGIVADRVGVVLNALGEMAMMPDKLFVEVGVYNGSFALGFLRNSRMRYLGVDPYSMDGGSFANDDDGTALFEAVSAEVYRFASPGREVELRRCGSFHAVVAFGGAAEVDAVFVDGAHIFEPVYHDLHAWWSVLKDGGMMFGHDFGPGAADVMAAAAVFCQEMGCSRMHLGADTVFWLQK